MQGGHSRPLEKGDDKSFAVGHKVGEYVEFGLMPEDHDRVCMEVPRKKDQDIANRHESGRLWSCGQRKERFF